MDRPVRPGVVAEVHVTATSVVLRAPANRVAHLSAGCASKPFAVDMSDGTPNCWSDRCRAVTIGASIRRSAYRFASLMRRKGTRKAHPNGAVHRFGPDRIGYGTVTVSDRADADRSWFRSWSAHLRTC